MNKRKTIGLMIDDISGSYQAPLWIKFKNKAEEMNCNLIAFEGKRLGSDNQLFSEEQHNFIYKLMDTPSLDGLIVISGPQVNYIGVEKFIDFCKNYNHIPLVSIGIKVPGALNLLVDGKKGMRDLIDHLIKQHGYKRIGFLNGSPNNSDAQERLQTYIKVLEENSITIDNDLIFSGDFEQGSGYRTANYILLNNIVLDALVCANDNMAIGALNALKSLNLNMDNSFYITGFDDSPILKKYNYSLTTVKQPLEEIVYTALSYITNNDTVEKEVFLPTKLVKRNSCGCPYTSLENESEDSNSVENTVQEYKLHELLQTNTSDELFEKITKFLDLFKINSGFIVKYSNGPIINNNKVTLPKQSEIIYAYHNNTRLDISEEFKFFNTIDVLPKKFMENCARYTYLINPLFFNNEHYGYIVFHVINNDVSNYDLLRGNIINTLRIASLISDNNEKQNKLMRTEKLAVLGEISRGLVNVIKNPANKIASDLIAIHELLDSFISKQGYSKACNEIYDSVENIIKSGRESSKKIIDISNSFKKQTLHMIVDSKQEFTMANILDEIQYLKNNNNCEFIISNDFDHVLKTDYNKLNYIISSIVQNAIYAYETQGGAIEISVSSSNNYLTVKIKDNAEGIPEQIKENLFKKCFIEGANKDGIGIGLFISNIFIKDFFAGSINFSSETGKGTVFNIHLPLKNIT
ncbi:UNVERIFIED_CONTAM: DNA-binding LacI/PurR family transcriptional regulator [Acetivibrio alkalicellulosi]